jgi:hypothetical protein
MTKEIALRPVREEDLPMLEELTQNPAKTGEFEWFGWSFPDAGAGDRHSPGPVSRGACRRRR